MTPGSVTPSATDPGRAGVRPVLDVMAVLAAQQQQLDDLTGALEAQHRTLLRVLEHLSPTTTVRHPDAHSAAAGPRP